MPSRSESILRGTSDVLLLLEGSSPWSTEREYVITEAKTLEGLHSLG